MLLSDYHLKVEINDGCMQFVLISDNAVKEVIFNWPLIANIMISNYYIIIYFINSHVGILWLEQRLRSGFKMNQEMGRSAQGAEYYAGCRVATGLEDAQVAGRTFGHVSQVSEGKATVLENR